MTNLFLVFHLLGAVCLFVGGIAVGVLQLKAIRQERPSQVHAFLRRAPFGAALVGTGALLTLGFGIALAEHKGLGLSPPWIEASLGLWVAAMVLGAFGGRTARHARHLAQQLASEGDAPSPELRALVSKRGPLWSSYASFALLLAIVVLMVWQPGSSATKSTVAAVIPARVQKWILSYRPQFAYIPTRFPSGVRIRYIGYDPVPTLRLLLYAGNTDSHVLSYSVYPGQCVMSNEPPDLGTFSVNGYLLGWDHTSGKWAVRRCVTQGNNSLVIEADALTNRWDRADLATIVAYAEPLR